MSGVIDHAISETSHVKGMDFGCITLGTRGTYLLNLGSVRSAALRYVCVCVCCLLSVRRNQSAVAIISLGSLASHAVDFRSRLCATWRTPLSGRHVDSCGCHRARVTCGRGAPLRENPGEMAHLNIDPATKCFLGGLAYASNEDSLRNYFSQFGEVRRDPRHAERNLPASEPEARRGGRARGHSCSNIPKPRTLSLAPVCLSLAD